MKKILVIDDDKRIRDMLNRVLSDSGYDTFEAENGKVGIRVFNENRFDLAIVDIVMPEMEGLETIKFPYRQSITHDNFFGFTKSRKHESVHRPV